MQLDRRDVARKVCQRVSVNKQENRRNRKSTKLSRVTYTYQLKSGLYDSASIHVLPLSNGACVSSRLVILIP